MNLVAIEAYLREAPQLHIYELGDLDPGQAPHVSWYVHGGQRLDAVVLVYRGLATPTVIALAHGDPAPTLELLRSIELPRRFYAHVTPGLEQVLPKRRHSFGRHLKMALASAPPPPSPDVVALDDADELASFYAAHYPGSYFDLASIDVGPYVGIREERGLVCVAGTHVHSSVMRVAALGNIATHTKERGRGLAGRTTATLCHRLAPDVDSIGLNVAARNTAAIACYRRIGFEPIAEYEDLLVDP